MAVKQNYPTAENHSFIGKYLKKFPPGLLTYLTVMGPGLVVMMADTDVGSIITAGQSGAVWGYKLLLWQFILIPILYIVQELTVRLGIFTNMGHGELISAHFGKKWAWVSVSGLGIAVVGALITEFSGIAGAGELYHLPRAFSVSFMAAFLLIIVLTGSYRRVEKIAIAIGLFELVFFAVAILAKPSLSAIGAGFLQQPFHNSDYFYLIAANIGAVIMPWMVFYQQSAIADKKLKPADFRHAKIDTAIGSVVTQLIMAAVLIATAATIGQTSGAQAGAGINTVGELSRAITPFIGVPAGEFVFSIGIIGAGMVAAIVATLALAWGLGEVTGYKRSLSHKPKEAKWFYLVYTACVILGALIVIFIPNLVTLNISVQIVNALLLPLVLGFLVALALKALPPERRLKGWYLVIVITVVLLTSGLGVYGGLAGIF